MRAVRLILFCLFSLCFVHTAVLAATPAADTHPFAKTKKKIIPADKLQARYKTSPIKLPPKPWSVPEAILDVTGKGVSIYYLIPVARVKNILPPDVKPYPNDKEIWFRVDIIHWTSLRPRSNPAKRLKKFVELAYRFEVIKNNERGTYPLRIYMDSPWPVLWARQFGSAETYPIHRADVNFSPFIHFFQLRRGKFAIAVVDVNPREGMGARMNDIFSRKKDAELWLGDGKDFLAMRDRAGLESVVRKFEVEIKNGEVKTLLLTEPVKWQILNEDEVLMPEKVLIMEGIYGTWAQTGDNNPKIQSAGQQPVTTPSQAQSE